MSPAVVVMLPVALCIALMSAVLPQAAPRRPTPASRTSRRDDGVPLGRPRRRSTRRPPPSDGDVAAWCDDVARRLRSGDTLTCAVATAVGTPAVAAALGPVLLALERGVPVHDAVGAACAPRSSIALGLAVIATCATLGGPAAEPLDRAASVLRAREVDRAERRVQAAQARSSAVVLTVLPVLTFAFLVVAAPSVRVAVTSTGGVALVVTGVIANLAGWRWMHRIIEPDQR